MITKIKLFFKKFWRKAVGMIGIAAVSAAGTTALIGEPVVIQGDTLTELTNRGIEARIQVLIKEPNFQDAIYYTPEVLTEKLSKQSYEDITLSIMAEKQKRVTDWKAFVQAESVKVAPVEEPIKEEPINEITK